MLNDVKTGKTFVTSEDTCVEIRYRRFIFVIIIIIIKDTNLLTIAKRLQTIRRITTACLALAESDYTRCHHRVDEIVHQ
jgi:hypothetical protein